MEICLWSTDIGVSSKKVMKQHTKDKRVKEKLRKGQKYLLFEYVEARSRMRAKKRGKSLPFSRTKGDRDVGNGTDKLPQNSSPLYLQLTALKLDPHLNACLPTAPTAPAPS